MYYRLCINVVWLLLHVACADNAHYGQAWKGLVVNQDLISLLHHFVTLSLLAHKLKIIRFFHQVIHWLDFYEWYFKDSLRNCSLIVNISTLCPLIFFQQAKQTQDPGNLAAPHPPLKLDLKPLRRVPPLRSPTQKMVRL